MTGNELGEILDEIGSLERSLSPKKGMEATFRTKYPYSGLVF